MFAISSDSIDIMQPQSDIKPVLVRLPAALAERLDRARGKTPRERFIREAIEHYLGAPQVSEAPENPFIDKVISTDDKVISSPDGNDLRPIQYGYRYGPAPGQVNVPVHLQPPAPVFTDEEYLREAELGRIPETIRTPEQEAELQKLKARRVSLSS